MTTHEKHSQIAPDLAAASALPPKGDLQYPLTGPHPCLTPEAQSKVKKAEDDALQLKTDLKTLVPDSSNVPPSEIGSQDVEFHLKSMHPL